MSILENTEYTFENIVERNKKDPRHFLKPSDKEIRALKKGDSVRLIFLFSRPLENGCGAERMWVTVKAIDGNTFIGQLQNEPVYIKSLKKGDLIEFSAQNIATVILRRRAPFDEKKFAVITRRALEKKEINWVVRTDDLADEQDSGWQFFYGDEDDKYLDDSRNGALISLESALSFEPLLEEPLSLRGEAYAFSESENKFVEVKD